MASITRRSRRAAIDAKCADCIHDPLAAGTRLQQITLCSVLDCALWPFRPKTKSPIPDTVLEHYAIRPDDPFLESILGRLTPPKTVCDRGNSLHECQGTGKKVSA